MKLGYQLLLSYLLILALVGYFLRDMVFSEAKPLVRQSAEEVLVDSANMLAEIVAAESKDGVVTLSQSLSQSLEQFGRRNPNASIWGMSKESIDLRIFVVDAAGQVIFDSHHEAEGEDFSEWNDIYLTLSGRYGARTTRTDPDDPTTTILYVAAPVKSKSDDRIIGAVTLAKPGNSIQPFVDRAGRQLLYYGIAAAAFCLLLGGLFIYWVSKRLGSLQAYAEAVTQGKRTEPPRLGGSDEVASLATAVTEMKSILEGKGYFEQAMQMFVHELKGPLAAIRGAGEILDEEVANPKLAKLSNNVVRESERLQTLVDRMLRLARLEKLEVVPEQSDVDIGLLVSEWADSRRVLLEAKQVDLQVKLEKCIWQGNNDLLELAINNLLDNAITFVVDSGIIRIGESRSVLMSKLTVFNQGPPVPEFAQARVFERFYSVPRENGENSSGLGLSMVREVALLHGGTATLENIDGGVLASMELPLKKTGLHTQNT